LDSDGFYKKDVQDNDPRIARDVNGAVQYSPQNTFGRTIDEHGQVL
jgi:hypothetical protein